MSNYETKDMIDCLGECLGIDSEVIEAVTEINGSTPETCLQILEWGTLYSGFDEIERSEHDRHCEIRKKVYPPKSFTLSIELGNAAMCEIEDLKRVLDCVLKDLAYRDLTQDTAIIYDDNGNKVGTWEMK